METSQLMTEKQIIALAKKEIELDHSINYISLPKTKEEIQKIHADKPIFVMGLRTYSNFKKKIYEYLIVKVYPDTWREQFLKVKLSEKKCL